MYYSNTDAVTIDRNINEPRKIDIDKMLMGGGDRMDFNQLSQLDTPRGNTRTHVTIPHSEVVHIMRSEAQQQGCNIITEAHLTTKNHNRYFGLFQINNRSRDVSTIVGLRNSHDKSIPMGVCIGDAPFVCSNLCFNNEFVTKAKHTYSVYTNTVTRMRDVIHACLDKQAESSQRIERMKNKLIGKSYGDRVIWDAIDNNVVTLKQGHNTHKQWHKPEHQEFVRPDVWSLQNAFTNVLRNESNRNTHLTRTTMLRQLLDKEFALAA